MIRTTIALVLALALFVWLDLGLARPNQDTTADQFIELVGPELRSENVVAAVEIEEASGAVWLHLRSRGRWRSREAFGAPVDETALSELVELLVQARGSLRSRAPAAGREFGFGSAQAVRIALCGPAVLDAEDHDRWLQVDLALGPEPGHGFGRLTGQNEIYELDRDAASFVAKHTKRGLPPLLETRLLSAAWLESTGGFSSLRVEPKDAPPFELHEERVTDGVRWIDDTGDEVLPFRIGGFLTFLTVARLDAIHDPRSAKESEFVGRLILRPKSGAERVLLMRPIAGGVLIFDSHARRLARFAEPRIELYLPRREDLGAGRAGNPWESFLTPQGR